VQKNPEVDAWFDAYDNPKKDLVRRVRDIVLGADPRISECVKWKAPTFMYKGNIASFFPKSKKHVSLMFHHGASITGRHDLLEGGGETSRMAKFQDAADVEDKADALRAVIRAWCQQRDADDLRRAGQDK
jgi:hypothetical protein